ncbi:pyridoxal-dependent decarboxylase [Paraphysoderma sedebokerense]|nr:pyridoxal-dependent decarboxylase [Paraphysoderma sedebokerense]
MKDPIVLNLAPEEQLLATQHNTKARLLQTPKPHVSPSSSLNAGSYQNGLLVTHSDSVDSVIKNRLVKNDDGELDDPFYVADIGEVIRQQIRFRKTLPRVEPFYAAKCNPDPVILSAMARMGAGFDCASRTEIDSVLKLGVNPSRIIYANPCKQASHIRFASQHGVRMMTFDNEDELYKIKKNHQNPLVVLRVLTDDSRSMCKFGVKFGAHAENTKHLLTTAQELGLPVLGVSFHVGSGCFDATAFRDAIVTAHRVFEEAKSLGIHMTLLDIGGGFPGADCSTGITFEAIGDVVRPALDEFFPEESGIKIIAEPGRYYVSSAFTLAVNIHARRVNRDNGDKKEKEMDEQAASFMYYINEGLYSSFNCIYFDHARVTPQVLFKASTKQYFYHEASSTVSTTLGASYPCSIWGPTCDSMDVITKEGNLPELNVGDWLYFDNMGAYTVSASSAFNGFNKCQVIWTNTESKKLSV